MILFIDPGFLLFVHHSTLSPSRYKNTVIYRPTLRSWLFPWVITIFLTSFSVFDLLTPILPTFVQHYYNAAPIQKTGRIYRPLCLFYRKWKSCHTGFLWQLLLLLFSFSVSGTSAEKLQLLYFFIHQATEKMSISNEQVISPVLKKGFCIIYLHWSPVTQIPV